jgi:putative hydrolase of the HAD superfamily
MPYSLAEYAAWLDRRNLLWPEVPAPEPVKATPFTRPLPSIRAVTLDVYGTLLRVTGGRLMLEGPDRLARQVAFEKTIEEFNIWNSLYRKPGPAWEQVWEQYKKFLDHRRLAAVARKGDLPEVNAATDLWRPLIAQWDRKEYQYDESLYGDRDDLAEKIAYYFQSRLQGIEAAPHAAAAMTALAAAGVRVALLSDGQPFTSLQIDRAFGNGAAAAAIDRSCSVLSYEEGLRKPSPTLYERCLERLEKVGIAPGQVLHVGSRLKEDLAAAKQAGMQTALYAGDATSLEATKEDVRDRRLAPDRLVTDLAQLVEIVC